MKNFLTHIAVLMSCMLLVSCAKKVQPAVMTDEILSKYSELGEALLTVKDSASAQTAASKVDALGDSLLETGKKADRLDEVTDRTRQRNREEYSRVMDELSVVKEKVGRQISDDREAMEILIKALEGFEEKESSLKGLYQHLGMIVL